MQKKCKRKLSAEFSSQKCELKKKKLKEKHDILDKLQLSNEYSSSLTKSNQPISSLFLQTTNIEENIKLTCYTCKKTKLTRRHHFYDQLCFECATFNYAKRLSKCDLTNKCAVVTGCRVKIGYEICLFLLRSKCKVIGTTRFPKDAFRRYAQESDFDQFKHLLCIYSLDLRDLRGVSKFIKYLNTTLTHLDILINNAAQTLRRNIHFYEHLLDDVECKTFGEFERGDDMSSVLFCEKDQTSLGISFSF